MKDGTKIKVTRNRQSATAGTVTITLNGAALATYQDDIRLINGKGPYYSEIIDGYASVVPDDEYVFDAVFNRREAC